MRSSRGATCLFLFDKSVKTTHYLEAQARFYRGVEFLALEISNDGIGLDLAPFRSCCQPELFFFLPLRNGSWQIADQTSYHTDRSIPEDAACFF
jgi:hypothetical protein